MRRVVVLSRSEIRKDLLKLSIPTILEQVLVTLMSYVDTAMVGHLGAESTTAVSATTTIIWLIEGVATSIGIALTVVLTKALGNQEIERVRHISNQCLVMTVGSGFLIGILALICSPFIPKIMGVEPKLQKISTIYFLLVSIPMIFRFSTMVLGSCIRATQDMKTPLKISIITNIVNVVLNSVFIYVLNMGVIGAGLGSMISYTLSGLLIFSRYRSNMYLYFKWSDFKVDTELIKKCIKISIPILCTNVTTCLGTVVFTSLVGKLGTTLFATHSIALTAETLFIIPSFGLRTAVSTSIGTLVGEGVKKKIDVVKDASIEVTLGIMIVCSAVLYFIATPFMYIFTSNVEVAELGGELLKLIAFSEPFYGLTLALEGVFYGLDKPKYAFVVETLSMWCVRILFTFLCINVWHTDLTAIWWCMIVDNVLKAILFIIPVSTKKGLQKLYTFEE